MVPVELNNKCCNFKFVYNFLFSYPIQHHRCPLCAYNTCRSRFKCDGTRTETRFHLLVKWMSPFKSVGGSVRSTTGSRGVRISGSHSGYTVFRGSVKSTGYPLHPPVFPSLPPPSVTMCHHISTGLYHQRTNLRKIIPRI
jgi:hypothetical protein